jgi:hypothetical protein
MRGPCRATVLSMDEIALRLARDLFDVPVIQNQYRSAFVEAMLDPYLAPCGWEYTGLNWRGWDFEHSPSGARLEVKQSAAWQSWSREGEATPGRGTFDIAARKGYFDKFGCFIADPGRSADVYVFAWNGTCAPNTNHRNPAQWEFYVVPTALLPEGQRKIGLSSIKAFPTTHPVTIEKLADAVSRFIDSSAGRAGKAAG